MPRVTYIDHEGSAQTVDVAVEDNVMQGALFNGVDGIIGECGGALACATCLCFVDDAWADKVGPAATPEERDMLESTSAGTQAHARLSCQIAVTEELDGLIVRTPESQY